jgi:K+/H+ antiporter YhaU regulatory subunit KhtT
LTIRDQDYNGVNDLSFVDHEKGRIRIVKYQYQSPKKAYDVITAFKSLANEGEVVNKRQFTTFDEEEAKKSAARDEDGNIIDGAITERDSFVTRTKFFTEGIELFDEVDGLQNERFRFLPSIFKRTIEGVPYGLVEPAIPAQQELNKRRSKAMHLLNSNRVMMDENAVADINDAVRQLSAADGVVIKKAGKEVRLLDENRQEYIQNLQMMERAERELDLVMGIFAEQLGQQTNAVSGLAIQQRQVASAKNQVSALDDHRADRKEFGRDLLDVMLATIKQETVFEVLDDDEISGTITLNKQEEIDGTPVVIRDVRTANLDVYVEEIPEFNAPAEELAQMVQQIIMNGQGNMLAQPEVLELLGFPPAYARRASKAVQKVLGASQQGAPNPAAEGEEAASPSQPPAGGLVQ